ncbi:MAG: hypothetical protein MUF54_24815, partial [Polyangiaceae bacterium]|nr:hypothetical protein [Polyangiaceae bacterium]
WFRCLRSGVPVFAFEFPCCLLLVVGRLSGSLKIKPYLDSSSSGHHRAVPAVGPAPRTPRGQGHTDPLAPTRVLAWFRGRYATFFKSTIG